MCWRHREREECSGGQVIIRRPTDLTGGWGWLGGGGGGQKQDGVRVGRGGMKVEGGGLGWPKAGGGWVWIGGGVRVARMGWRYSYQPLPPSASDHLTSWPAGRQGKEEWNNSEDQCEVSLRLPNDICYHQLSLNNSTDGNGNTIPSIHWMFHFLYVICDVQ